MFRTRSSYKALKDYGSGYDTKEEKRKALAAHCIGG